MNNSHYPPAQKAGVKEELLSLFRMNAASKSRLVFLCGCLVFALTFELYMLQAPFAIEIDSCRYLLSGKNLVSGKGYSIWGEPSLLVPPVYPVLTGILSLFVEDLELAGRLVSIAAFLVSIVLFFKLAEALFHTLTAYIATLLLVTNKFILQFSHKALTHSVDVFLIILAISRAWQILKSETCKLRDFIFLGIILACCILNRPENIILSLAMVGTVFSLKKSPAKRKAVAFICLLAAAGGLLFPYANFLHRHTGKWTLTTKGVHLEFYKYLSSSDPSAHEKTRFPDFRQFDAFRYARENRGELSSRYVNGITRVKQQLDIILQGKFGFLLIGLGLFVCPWDRERKKIMALLFSCLAPLIILPLGNTLVRYFMFAMPVFILGMAMGMENLSLFMGATFHLPIRIRQLLIASAVIAVNIPGIAMVSENKILPRSAVCKEMGLWMKTNIPDIEKKKISSPYPIVSFYSGASNIRYPRHAGSLSGVMRVLKNIKADYLIIESEIVHKGGLYFQPLLDEKAPHPGLEVVHVIAVPDKIILYRLLKPPE